MEFDPAATSTELIIVRYFENRLKSSIKAEIDQDATYLDYYEELVAKAVKVEAKAGLQPSFYMRETDLQVLRRSQSAHTTAHKVQTQGVVNCGDKSKVKSPASTPAQDFEPSNKARKDKKKKYYRDKRDSREFKDSTTLAFGVNAAKVGGKKKKNKKDVSEVKYFNCNKKKHYVNKCPEPPKN